MTAIPLGLIIVLIAAAQASADFRPRSVFLDLSIGDSLRDVEKKFPPKRHWASWSESGVLSRVLLDRMTVKHMPLDVEAVRLGFRGPVSGIAHIQIIYTADQSRTKPLDELVRDLALDLGEPRRAGRGMVYFWRHDGRVIVASNARLLSADGRSEQVHTSLEIMDRNLFDLLGE